jgi:hypothetical protein
VEIEGDNWHQQSTANTRKPETNNNKKQPTTATQDKQQEILATNQQHTITADGYTRQTKQNPTRIKQKCKKIINLKEIRKYRH